MSDAALVWGQDMGANPIGDVTLTTGSLLGQQRILRRLLTNPGDYLWHPDYGAGLASFIGRPNAASNIRATIRSQIFLEAVVSRTPEPAIDVQPTPDGSIYVSIRYVDSLNNTSQVLSFSVSS